MIRVDTNILVACFYPVIDHIECSAARRIKSSNPTKFLQQVDAGTRKLNINVLGGRYLMVTLQVTLSFLVHGDSPYALESLGGSLFLFPSAHALR